MMGGGVSLQYILIKCKWYYADIKIKMCDRPNTYYT